MSTKRNIQFLKGYIPCKSIDNMKTLDLVVGDVVHIANNYTFYVIEDATSDEAIPLPNSLFAKPIPNPIAPTSPDSYTVDTIEKLKGLSFLKEGDVVEVLGYYTAGDGAGHQRIIASEDDGSGVQLGNGLWANIVHNGEVNVSWFGAKGDGVTDDTKAILKAMSYPNILFSELTYRISYRVTFSNNVNFMGATLLFDDGLIAKDDYVFLIESGTKLINGNFNINSGEKDKEFIPNTTDAQKYPKVVCGVGEINDVVIENCSFINSQVGLFKFFGECKKILIEKCYFNNIIGTILEFENVSNLKVVCNNVGDRNGDIRSHTQGAFVLANGDNVYVGNNVIGNTSDTTIYLIISGENGCIVENNYIKFSGKDAIKTKEGSKNCIIKNNRVFVAGAHCITTTSSTNTIVDGNIVGYEEAPTDILDPYSNFEIVLTVDGCSGQIKQKYENYPAFGINGYENIVVNNHIQNCNSSTVISGSKNNTIFKNNIIKNCNSEVALKLMGVNNLAEGNLFIDNVVKTALIYDYVYNSNKIIRGNTFDNNSGVHILIDKDSSGVKIEDNIFKNYSASRLITLNGAISPYAIKDISIKNNILENSVDEYIIYCRYIDGLTIDGNVVSCYSNRYGLVAEDSKNISCCNNTFENGYATRFLRSSYININNNTLKDCTRAFDTPYSSDINIIGNVSNVSVESANYATNFNYNININNATTLATQLNTPYYTYKMEQEGVLQDYYSYLDEKYAYDSQIQAEEKAKYEAYNLALQNNPNLTWEEFEAQYSNSSMMNLSLVERLEEPTIPESVVKFMEKYLGTTSTPKAETKSTPKIFSFDEVDKLNDTLKKL